jgi:nitroreductase
MTISADALLDRLSWRYAVKKFDPARTIPADTWSAIERALQLSPSSYGIAPWRFVVITDQATKAKLPPISWNQPQPRDCSHMVVLAARVGISAGDIDRYVELIKRERNATDAMLADYRAMMLNTVQSTPPERLDEWCARQCYIALGFLMSACAMLSVDACPMEGIEASKYDELLGLPERGYRTVVGCAVGYRSADDWLASLKKVRPPAEETVLRV